MKKQKYSFLRQTLQGTSSFIIWILVLTIINSKLTVCVPMFIQYVLDGVVLGQENVIPAWIRSLFYTENTSIRIVILCILLVMINVLIFAVKYFRSKVGTKFNLRINKNVKQEVLRHIPQIEYAEFCKINHADVIQRVNNDATTYAEFFNSQINLFLDTIFIVGFSVQALFELSTVVAWFVMILCAMIIMLSVWFFKVSKPLVQDTVEANRKIIEKTTNVMENSKMQKIYNRQDLEIENFKKVNEEYRIKDKKLGRYKVIYGIGTHSIRNFKEPIILLYGGILVLQGKMTLAVVSILLTYSTKVADYIYDSVDKLKTVNEFFVAYKKLSNLMRVKEDDKTKAYKKLAGDIVFRDVSIKISDQYIIKNIHLKIKQGENIAVIGDNGAGKTVFAKTLMGFYDYDGEILIGEDNIKDVSPKSIRDYIGLVLQNTYLFHHTIRDNVKMTNTEILDIEVEEALKIADIYQDVENFENKLDTMLENGGENLSGGQKQRLAIARNIVADNEFIIFDDSLSKLDTKTKLNILENMIAINKGIIMISHDIHVVKACDKVMFIHNESLALDTHENFMKENEQYRQIIEMKQNTILEDEEE